MGNFPRKHPSLCIECPSPTMSAIVMAEGYLNNVKTTCSSLSTSSKGDTRQVSMGDQPPSMWRARVKRKPL